MSAELHQGHDAHVHQVSLDRFTAPIQAVCDICEEVLIPDVARWARDRGLITNAQHDLGGILAVDERAGTITDAIDKAVNRDPGLPNG